MTRLVNLRDIGSAFNAAEKVLDAWRRDSGPNVKYHGQMRKCLSEDAFEACEALAQLGTLENDGFHDGARLPAIAVTKFAAKWLEFTDKTKASADVDPAGGPELWAAYEDLRASLVPKEWPKPEPIRQLIERDKVPAWQVAKIYGFASQSMVEEELAKPGTHYDPKTWTGAGEKNFLAELDAKWKSRKPVSLPLMDPVSSGESDPPPAAKAAPESIETLLAQRVPYEQIAKMKGVSLDTVKSVAAGIESGDEPEIIKNVDPQLGLLESGKATDEHREKFEASERAKKAARFAELKKTGMSVDDIRATMAKEGLA
jgi:hypothetical protein